MKSLTIMGLLVAMVLVLNGCSSSGAANAVVGADEVSYKNTNSGLTATDVQAAIDELENLLNVLDGRVDTTCPSGMAKVTTGGRVCVDTIIRESSALKSFDDANDACIADKSRLCYAYELITACNNNVITDGATAPGAEWSANIIAAQLAVSALNADCTTTATANFTSGTLAYRCCKDK